MSTFIQNIKHPKTGKPQEALCLDDYYGSHRYGYAFRKDGKEATWSDLDLTECDIFNEDELK